MKVITSNQGPPCATYILVPGLHLPTAPAKLAFPQSLTNIERPLLYFPSSTVEAEARNTVWQLIPESHSATVSGAPC